MPTQALKINRYIDYSGIIHDFIDQTEKYSALCDSPQRVESKFCAYLAGWESSTCHDSKASHWFEVWQTYCRKHHHGETGRTLAEPVMAIPLSERWAVPQEESVKAYATVREGLRRVLKATLDHYSSGIRDDKALALGIDEPSILFQKIRMSFKTAKSFASPEGLEAFLLTLIELFELSLGATADAMCSREVWRSEIMRRRLGGSSETRTLADVAPVDVRLKRQKAFPECERREILRTLISSMREIAKDIQIYLDTIKI